MPWPAGECLDHAFLLGWAVVPPLLRHVKERFQSIGSVDDGAAVYRPALRMQLEHELGDYAKVRSCTPDAPEEIRVLRLAGREDAPIGSDNGCLK